MSSHTHNYIYQVWDSKLRLVVRTLRNWSFIYAVEGDNTSTARWAIAPSKYKCWLCSVLTNNLYLKGHAWQIYVCMTILCCVIPIHLCLQTTVKKRLYKLLKKIFPTIANMPGPISIYFFMPNPSQRFVFFTNNAIVAERW